jgi:hypothetical protein
MLNHQLDEIPGRVIFLDRMRRGTHNLGDRQGSVIFMDLLNLICSNPLPKKLESFELRKKESFLSCQEIRNTDKSRDLSLPVDSGQPLNPSQALPWLHAQQNQIREPRPPDAA